MLKLVAHTHRFPNDSVELLNVFLSPVRTTRSVLAFLHPLNVTFGCQLCQIRGMKFDLINAPILRGDQVTSNANVLSQILVRANAIISRYSNCLK